MIELNEIIHSKPRLLIMLTLFSFEECDFNFLKNKLQFSDGVLSVHIQKLEKAGYIKVRKRFIGKKPNTSYKITDKGRKALIKYIKQMKEIFNEFKI